MPYVAATECDNKQRRACRIFSLRMHVLDKAINIFKKFHVEVKFRSKVMSHVIRGTNFWDTLRTAKLSGKLYGLF